MSILDDFRTAAANGRGVDLIPYKNLRQEATSIADEVNRSKTATKWKYTTFERQKDNLLEKKEEKEEEVEEQKEEIEDLKDKDKDFNTSSQEKDLEKLEDELEDIVETLNKMNKNLEEGAEAWKRLWNARGGLRETFDDVLKELKNTKSKMESYFDEDTSDSDKKIFEKSIYVIEGMIEDEKKEHGEQEKGAKDTEEDFRELIKKTTA
jgi:chromosome segregation ATPase